MKSSILLFAIALCALLSACSALRTKPLSAVRMKIVTWSNLIYCSKKCPLIRLLPLPRWTSRPNLRSLLLLLRRSSPPLSTNASKLDLNSSLSKKKHLGAQAFLRHRRIVRRRRAPRQQRNPRPLRSSLPKNQPHKNRPVEKSCNSPTSLPTLLPPPPSPLRKRNRIFGIQNDSAVRDRRNENKASVRLCCQPCSHLLPQPKYPSARHACVALF